jgi:hypothetical protein
MLVFVVMIRPFVMVMIIGSSDWSDAQMSSYNGGPSGGDETLPYDELWCSSRGMVNVVVVEGVYS